MGFENTRWKTNQICRKTRVARLTLRISLSWKPACRRWWYGLRPRLYWPVHCSPTVLLASCACRIHVYIAGVMCPKYIPITICWEINNRKHCLPPHSVGNQKSQSHVWACIPLCRLRESQVPARCPIVYSPTLPLHFHFLHVFITCVWMSTSSWLHRPLDHWFRSLPVPRRALLDFITVNLLVSKPGPYSHF